MVSILGSVIRERIRLPGKNLRLKLLLLLLLLLLLQGVVCGGHSCWRRVRWAWCRCVWERGW